MLNYIKDTLFNINGNIIPVNQATINTEASIDGRYDAGDRHSFFFYNQGPIKSSVSFSYYLTGNDAIKNYINLDNVFLSGNISNIKFFSGCLSSYTVRFSANQPIEVDATIDIYDPLQGTLQRNNNRIGKITPLNTNNLAIENSYSGELAIGNIKQASFEYAAEITPIYYSETGLNHSNILPNRIFWGKKSIRMNIIDDNIESYLPVNSQFIAARIEARDYNNTPMEVFSISGKINSKNISIDQGNPILKSFDIIQNRVSNQPTIERISPSSASSNTVINIFGSNLANATSLFVGDDPVKEFSILNDSQIQFRLPENVNSGFIRVNTFEENAYSPSGLYVNYSPIIISNFYPTVLKSGASAFINGSNLNKVSEVWFNNIQSPSFTVVNDKLLVADVPGYTLNGQITVKSNSRNISGVSANNFYTPPGIISFGPLTGLPNTQISITGYNFDSINYVSINNIIVLHTVVNTGRITFNVPTGNTWGNIKVVNSYNQVATSQLKFVPDVVITGTSIRSGLAYAPISISGYNFQPELLYGFNDGTYKVEFNGVSTGFYIQSSNILTGRVPKGANSGPIQLYKSDGSSTYQSTGSFIYINDPAIITNVFPSGFISGSSFDASLIGSNIKNLTRVILSGHISGSTSGKVISIWNKNYNINLIPTDTANLRSLNTSLIPDIFGIGANIDPVLSLPQSLSGNSFLTGTAITTGRWFLVVENEGGTGNVFGPLNISSLPKISHLDSNKYYMSSSTNINNTKENNHSFALDSNTGTSMSTSTFGTTGTLTIQFPTICEIHRVKVISHSQSYLDDGANPRSLIIGLGTGTFGSQSSLVSSGSVQLGPYSTYESGYTINTGNLSWRHEANFIQFQSTYKIAGSEQLMPLKLAEIEIYGIPIYRQSS